MMKIFVFILAALLFPGKSAAISLADESLENVFKSSAIVANISVLKITANCETKYACGAYMIGGLLGEIFASEEKHESLIGICSSFPLEVGKDYVLFLDKGSIESGCDFILPVDGAFQKRGSHTFRVSSPNSSIWVDFEGRKYETNAVVEPDFDDRLRQLIISFKNKI